eukprot:COSAG06_NODE_2266_length_7209_cov_1.865139_3_plen_79_part_00
MKTVCVGAAGPRPRNRIAACALRQLSGRCVAGDLKATKVPMEFALGTLRLSVGRHSTPAEIDTAADLIVAEAKKQKQQ